MSAPSPRAALLPAGLRVSADLLVQVDDLDVRVEGDGAELRVTTADARALVAGVRQAAAAAGVRGGRSSAAVLARVGEELAAAGLVARVITPTGPVLEAGAGVDSRLGRLALGSSRVRVHRAGALAAVGGARWGLAAGLAALVGAVAVAAARSGRRS
ncbi:hypothetical protein [Quadrisphaera sp. KR29]|uniref:hypothetical protein n=1 Tax=Quadrisphaera sp. KR29 TaxID=3461391 RepID=UPI0040448CF7